MYSDVLVVGAGPAGLYAAGRLAAAGHSVRVLEEHAGIGEPVHCTGILGTEAFALPGIAAAGFAVGWPSVAEFHSPTGHRLVYAGPPGEACVIDRGAFDRHLAQAAARAGAAIETGVRAVGLEVGPGRVAVHAAARGGRDGRDPRAAAGLRTWTAQVCVLACGAAYGLQRTLGWGRPPLYLGSAQTEVAAAPADRLDVFLRPELGATGFGWLVPVVRDGEARAKVGVMAAAGARRTLRALLGELRAGGRVGAERAPLITRLLPLGPLARTYGDRVLAVGDAAGLVKPTTGGGIYYSLLSAGWAAETLVRAFDRGLFSAAGLASYEETWRARLGRELRVGVWFRRLAARLTPGDLDALTRLAIEDGLMPVVRAAARFNWHHELILRALRHPGVLQIALRRLLPGSVPPASRRRSDGARPGRLEALIPAP
jgi:geranylgeranyl reductase family protein